ncbi:MAG: indole-3-glycerol phosphate synthase TrpC [Pseudomonadota bacterium]
MIASPPTHTEPARADKVDVLERICAYKRQEVAAAKAQVSATEIVRVAASAPPVRPFAAALEQVATSGRPALIAEIKKASPSKGLIRADFDPAALATAYEQAGAACLSVLTDTPSFQGAPAYLGAARNACALPVLRKDFMVDVYQVAEARAWGADCILIILACTDDSLAADLAAAAQAHGMDVIAEVHDRAELERALALDGVLLGVNNRNLRTFDTRLETCVELKAHVPADRQIIAESGIANAQDIAHLRAEGIHRFLVGESLMRADDVCAATRALLADTCAAA